MARSSCRGRPTSSAGAVSSTVTMRAVRRCVLPATTRARSPSWTGSSGSDAAHVARQVDQLAEEQGELVDVVEHLADDLLPLALRKAVHVPEQFDVAAQARQRRAHLVAGVRHEPALLVLRTGDRRHHRGEARRQAADLAGATLVDGCRQVERRGDLVGGVAQARDGSGEAGRDRPSQRRRHRGRQRDDRHESESEAIEDGLRLGEAAGDLERPTVVPGGAQQPVRHAVDPDRAKLHGAAGERTFRLVDRQGRAAVDARRDRSGARNELRR